MKLTKREADAIELYRGFREDAPRKIIRLDFNIPDVAIPLGPLEYVGYKTTHGGKTEHYHHDFASGSRPLLCAGTGDNELYMLGGRYRVTDLGIVDLDSRLREIRDPEHGNAYKKRR